MAPRSVERPAEATNNDQKNGPFVCNAFLDAPRDAIGYQLANHEIITGTKRWIRLTTYPGA